MAFINRGVRNPLHGTVYKSFAEGELSVLKYDEEKFAQSNLKYAFKKTPVLDEYNIEA